MITPRFQGKAIKDGPKHWKWELHITIGTLPPIVMTAIHPFSKDVEAKRDRFTSKAEALDHLNATLPEIIKEVCKGGGLPMPEAIIDLKKNETVSSKDYFGEDV